MTSRLFFGFVLSLLLLCNAALAQKLTSDVPYVKNGHERHVLDIYIPEKPAKNILPVMFWIHGGGWRKGDKSDVALKPRILTERGFVFVSTNYRLLPEVTMEALTGDVARSLGWVHKYISRYGGDPKRIFVGGHSAGAQLAALICTDDRYLKTEGVSFEALKGCIAVDGATYDVPKAIMAAETRRAIYGARMLPFGYRQKFGNDPDKHVDFSAVTHVAKGKGIPPFLLLFFPGNFDSDFQTRRLESVLLAADVPTTVYGKRDSNHIRLNDDLGRPDDPATQALYRFLDPLISDDGELTVLTGEPGTQLQQLLMREFDEHDARRLEAFEAIKSRADCEKWQRERREFFIRQLGGFPERTPLNANIVGELRGEGYRVEKILFESRPGHHVTANLYLPDAKGPFPAVLVPCGHSRNGKAAGHYQRVSSLMAKNGIAALCYDPIGQGERYQCLAESDQTHYRTAPQHKVVHPRVQFLPTIEHTTMGVGSILLGSNVAQYRIWDDMRAIDYLESRKDIIPDRIGCTGNSGGGTMTAYLMALDDRIVSAAPACFLTTFRRLIETVGAQDAEQNIFGQIAFGMDEPDYVMMRAPNPTLICAATRDVTFDIGGTWDLFRQSKRFYTRMGFAERVDMIEADARHGFTILLRTASVRFMRRWLLGKDDVIHEMDPLPDPLTDEIMREHQYTADWTDKQLQCSPDGQVMLMKGERSVFDINASIERELQKQRQAAWEKLNGNQRRELVRRTIGPLAVAKLAKSFGRDGESAKSLGDFRYDDAKTIGTIQRDSYRIEKLVLPANGNQLSLPGLLFVPETVSRTPVLYLHGESMKAEAQPGGRCEQLAKAGHIVLSAELSGIGETETGHDKRDYGRGLFGRDSQEFYLAYLMGRSFVGMRTTDVFRWADYLSRYGSNAEALPIQLIATGEAAIPALHAAALEPSRFESIRLKSMIRSWAEVVAAPENKNQLVNTVHGALRHYDLPELVELAGKALVKVEGPVDATGREIN